MMGELWKWWLNIRMIVEYEDDGWIMKMMIKYKDDGWIWRWWVSYENDD
jgi:hypothetical protein